LHNRRLERVLELARSAQVELMTHPAQREEYAQLSSEKFRAVLGRTGSHTHSQNARTPRP